MKGENPEDPACGGSLSNIVLARHLYAYGIQDVCLPLLGMLHNHKLTVHRTTGTTPTVSAGSATALGTDQLVALSSSQTQSLVA